MVKPKRIADDEQVWDVGARAVSMGFQEMLATGRIRPAAAGKKVALRVSSGTKAGGIVILEI